MRQQIFLLVLVLSSLKLEAQPIDARSIDTRTIVPPSPNVASLLKFTEVPVSKYTGLPETTVPVYTIHAKKMDLPVTLQYHSGGVRVTEAASWVGMGWALNFGGVITQTIRGLKDESPYGRFNTIDVADKTNPSLCDLYQVILGHKEGEPDLYNFSFNGVSGEFVLDDNKNVVQIPQQKLKIEPVMPPNWHQGIPFMIASWKITDQNGIQYFFEETESVTSISKQGNGVTVGYPSQAQLSWYISKIVEPSGSTISFAYDTYNSLDYFYSSESRQIVTSDPTRVDEAYTNTTDATIYQGQNVNPGKRIHSISFDGGRMEFIAGGNRCDLSGDKYLSKIDVYNSSNQRIKELALNYKYFIGINTYNPGDIDCSSEPGPIIETSSEAHNYYKDRRLFLTSVDEVDNNGSKVDSYKFDYENSLGLPNRFSAQQDWWGLYNGNGYTSLLQNTHQLPNGNYDILGRNANLTYGKQGVLTRITYPTGGYSQFDFELNSFPNVFTPSYVVHPQVVYTASGENRDSLLGSFTVGDSSGNKSISFQVQRCVFGPTGTSAAGFYVKDGNDSIVVTGAQVTSFNQQTGNGTFSLTFANGSYRIYSYAVAEVPCTYTITVYEWTEQPPVTDSSFAYGGLRVNKIATYDPVANDTLVDTYSYAGGTTAVQLGPASNNYTSYQYAGARPLVQCGEYRDKVFTIVSNTNYPIGTNASGFVGYNQVIVKHLDGEGNDLGYTLNQFLVDPADVYPNFSVQAANHPVTDWFGTHSLAPVYHFSWGRGKMTKNYQFVNSGSNTYRAAHMEDYYYSGPHLSDTVKAVAAASLFASVNSCQEDTCYTRHEADIYHYTPYMIWTGYQLLDSVVTQDIDSTLHSLKTTTSYTYDTSNLLPARVKTTNSKNEITISNQTYPMDYQVGGTVTNPVVQGIQNLQNQHVISPVIEKYIQRTNADGSNARTLSAIMTTYKPTLPFPDSVFNWEPPQLSAGFTPLSVSSSNATKDPNYQPRINFSNYDSFGNIVQQKKINNPSLSYVWDYHGAYPVAEIKNASVSQVAYTSFEADGMGGWTIGAGAVDTVESMTGANSYLLNNGTISRSGSNSGTTYFVSYWTRNNSSFSITGTIAGYPTKGKTINGWTLYVHKVSGQSSITINGNGYIDELRLYPAGAQMTTYTYTPLVGMTSQCDIGNRVTYYEYDGLQRLKRIRDQDQNIIKTFDYQYQGPSGCGNNCYIITMQTLSGTSTIGYPVGVFNIHGKLLDTASTPSRFVTLWNADTANARIGTLSIGGDPLHFNMTLNSGMILPSGVTGCRYYKVDLAVNKFDGVRNPNAAYVDFGDGTGMRLPGNATDVAPSLPANTTVSIIASGEYATNIPYYIHSYPNATLKTVTFYHNDSAGTCHLDNATSPASSMLSLINLRGNLPQNLAIFGSSCYQDGSMNTVAAISNWSSIHSIQYFNLVNGDQLHPNKNMSYGQDFMQYNQGLKKISTALSYYRTGYRDTTFRLSRLKSDWNTYFTELEFLQINEDHWSHEDLSGLKHLNFLKIIATTQNHQDDPNSPLIPLDTNVINNILIQVAAGAGQRVTNGTIILDAGGGTRDGGSDTAVQSLLNKGWIITINGVTQTNP
jgi:hypothetical protein